MGSGADPLTLARVRSETACANIRAMYRWVEHSGEVEVAIEAATEREVFADALAALSDLLGIEGDGRERRAVAASATDRPALLAAWLEELVFLAETEGFEPVGVEDLQLGDDSVQASVRGRRGDPRPLIKAVTYHRLAFVPTGSGYRASVVLDV